MLERETIDPGCSVVRRTDGPAWCCLVVGLL